MLIRFIPFFVNQWEEAFGAERTFTAKEIPHWALSSFVPTDRDNGRISLYEIDETVTVSDIASAMAFLKQSTPRWFFVGTSRKDIEKRALTLIPTTGATHHPAVNARHFDVEVPDRTALSALTSAFLKGEPLNVERREIEAKLTSQARADAIDWISTAKNSNDNAWKYVRDFAKKGAVTLKGQPVVV